MHQLEWFPKYNTKSIKTYYFEGCKMAVKCNKIMRFLCVTLMLKQNNFWYILTILIGVIIQITLYPTILFYYEATKVCFHSSLWSTSLYGYIVIFAYFEINISLCFTLELKVLKVGRLIASSIVHMNTCQNKFGILHTYLMFKIVGEIWVCCLRNELYKGMDYTSKG